MANNVTTTLKTALRNRIKKEVLKNISTESKERQSKAITEKVLLTESFREAKRISIYCSTPTEVNTLELLREMFRLDKHVYIPIYEGMNMEMVRLRDYDDFEALPLTKWNIKQPKTVCGRENALTNGHGLDLFIMPGVAFTMNGGRMGHGMGYYDSYLTRHFNLYPQKKVTLIGIAFREQIVTDEILPLDTHDVRLNCIITE